MRKPLWEIKQAAEGTLQLYIYGDVEGEEFDWESWRYVQSDNSAEHFREELAKHPDVSRIRSTSTATVAASLKARRSTTS